MIKRLSTIISGYLEDKNSSLSKKDVLKIQYTLEAILSDLSKFIIYMLQNEKFKNNNQENITININ